MYDTAQGTTHTISGHICVWVSDRFLLLSFAAAAAAPLALHDCIECVCVCVCVV